MDIEKIVKEAIEEVDSEGAIDWDKKLAPTVPEQIAEEIFEEFKTKVSEAFKRASFDTVHKCSEVSIGAGSTYAILNDLINKWLTKEFIETPINE